MSESDYPGAASSAKTIPRERAPAKRRESHAPAMASFAPRPTLRPKVQVEAEAAQPDAVIVSSWDRGTLQRISLALAGRATVVLVRDEADLVRKLRTHRRGVLLLDAMAPAIPPLDAARALGPRANDRPVLVWGAGRKLREQLQRLPTTRRWLYPEQPAGAAELAATLQRLIESPRGWYRTPPGDL